MKPHGLLAILVIYKPKKVNREQIHNIFNFKLVSLKHVVSSRLLKRLLVKIYRSSSVLS